MPTVSLKRGVFITGSHPCIFAMIDAAKKAYYFLGMDVVITSGCEGTHSTKSLHYQGKALDFRTRHLTDGERVEIMDRMKADLGEDYDILYEGDHFHCEYDPKPE